DFAKRKLSRALAIIGGAGILACSLAVAFDLSPIRFYDPAIYDYWHTSPNFVLMRGGILLVLMLLAYAWCRWGFGQRGFGPLIQLGQTSLLVYWVHIEFVYGRLSFLPKRECGVLLASAGLLVIFLAMLGLSIWRTRQKKRGATASEPLGRK